MNFLKANKGNEEILGSKFIEWCCMIMFETLEYKPGYTHGEKSTVLFLKNAL